jgi:hypothetical protein
MCFILKKKKNLVSFITNYKSQPRDPKLGIGNLFTYKDHIFLSAF